MLATTSSFTEVLAGSKLPDITWSYAITMVWWNGYSHEVRGSIPLGSTIKPRHPSAV